MKQRYLHYFFVNELLSGLVLVWLITAENPLLPRVVFVPLGFVLFNVLLLISMACVVFVRRYFRGSYKLLNSAASPRFDLGKRRPSCPLPLAPTFVSKEHIARDGVKLHVRLAVSKPGAPVVLLAAPLGQCGPSIYDPIVARFGDQFTYVTWDYRGFFSSQAPDRPRRVAINEHAEDAMEARLSPPSLHTKQTRGTEVLEYSRVQVLSCCGFDHCEVMIGHSMGTAVAFETCLLFPHRVGSLVILNGFHGHVFQTAFQPLCRYPFVGDAVGKLVEMLIDHPMMLDTAFRVLPRMMRAALPKYASVFGSKLMCRIAGDTYFLAFLESYTSTIISSKKNLTSYLSATRPRPPPAFVQSADVLACAGLFQELNAHSVFHLLHEIHQPTLLISGLLDPFIPALQSVEIARRIKDCVHYCDPFSSHASILESPEWCMAEIEYFLQTKTKVLTARNGSSAPRDKAAAKVSKAN